MEDFCATKNGYELYQDKGLNRSKMDTCCNLWSLKRAGYPVRQPLDIHWDNLLLDIDILVTDHGQGLKSFRTEKKTDMTSDWVILKDTLYNGRSPTMLEILI